MSVVASGNDRRPGTCCLTVTNTRVPVENIVKYEMQDSTAICTLRAVRFHTKRSITICSDPDSKWAKRAMNIVDGRTTAKPTMCYTSTTNTIPTVTTTNKTPGTQTETSTRNGGPESCCNNVTTTKSILKNSIKSRSKKRLHKFQARVWQIKQKSSGTFV